MNQLRVLVLLGLSVFIILESCSIQKRKHLPGWYISTNWSKTQKKSLQESSASSLVQERSINLKSNGQQSTIAAREDIAINIHEDTISTTGIGLLQVNQSSTDSLKRSSPGELKSWTNNVNTVVTCKELDTPPTKKVEEESSHFWGELTGGFLGVLVALIGLVPIFVFLLLLGDTDVDDVFVHSANDSPFTRAFKTAFNVVIKYGIIVLWVVAVLALLAVVFALGYQLYGIFGGIVALIIVIGLFVLFAYLISEAVDFILPN